MKAEPLYAELKPCPFCGHHAELIKYEFLDLVSYAVRCPGCYIQTWGAESPEEATARWNRRALSTNPHRCVNCQHWVRFESSLLGVVLCCTGQGPMNIQKAPDDFCSCWEAVRDENL